MSQPNIRRDRAHKRARTDQVETFARSSLDLTIHSGACVSVARVRPRGTRAGGSESGCQRRSVQRRREVVLALREADCSRWLAPAGAVTDNQCSHEASNRQIDRGVGGHHLSVQASRWWGGNPNTSSDLSQEMRVVDQAMPYNVVDVSMPSTPSVLI